MPRALIALPLVLLLAGCTAMFFQPMERHVRTPAQLGLAYEDVFFESADGLRLHAWFLKAEGPARGTVLFLHGNAENISTHIASVRWLPARGFNVFMPDYRGYGRSPGVPTLPGVAADVDSALAALLARPDVDPRRIVIFGQSLGAALAIRHAARGPHRGQIRGVVAESAFAGYRAITREKLASFWLTWPFQWLPDLTVEEDYSPLPLVAALSPIPLLVIHGDQDPIVPVEHGRQLFAAAGEPKELWIIERGGHIGSGLRPDYRERLAAWLHRRMAEGP